MEVKTEKFKDLARAELQNIYSRRFLKVGPPIMVMKRDLAMATFPDIPAARAYGAAIKAEAVAQLNRVS